jgi:hypothetical protein
MIQIQKIKDEQLDILLQNFEDCMNYVFNLDYPIKLNNYGYFLRSALNTLQNDEFDYLLSRLNNNKELERNEGGYSIEYLAENNPKKALTNLINHLKSQKPKTERLFNFITQESNNSILVADREDIDFLKYRNSKIQVITNQELKRKLKNDELKNKLLAFYSFNGSKDFDFIYHLPNEVVLILYIQEIDLYHKQLQIHKTKLEQEITSDDRFKLCGIKYEPIIEKPIKVNPTLEKIIEQLDERSKTAYEGYKNESDSILDDLEEQIHYKLTFFNGTSAEMESNETTFDKDGNLIKGYKLRIGDKIRIYPKEQLAENLLQIAIESEPEMFGKVEVYAKLWLNTLKDLDEKYPIRVELYSKLKEKGLRVLPPTVDAYFRGHRKYPMFNSDLKAILTLSSNNELINQISQILKSKRLYNSTMIALGRGIKQELKQFLKEKMLGDILNKRNFTKETLKKFIEEQMPLLTITDIQTISYEQVLSK